MSPQGLNSEQYSPDKSVEFDEIYALDQAIAIFGDEFRYSQAGRVMVAKLLKHSLNPQKDTIHEILRKLSDLRKYAKSGDVETPINAAIKDIEALPITEVALDEASKAKRLANSINDGIRILPITDKFSKEPFNKFKTKIMDYIAMLDVTPILPATIVELSHIFEQLVTLLEQRSVDPFKLGGMLENWSESLDKVMDIDQTIAA